MFVERRNSFNFQQTFMECSPWDTIVCVPWDTSVRRQALPSGPEMEGCADGHSH